MAEEGRENKHHTTNKHVNPRPNTVSVCTALQTTTTFLHTAVCSPSWGAELLFHERQRATRQCTALQRVDWEQGLDKRNRYQVTSAPQPFNTPCPASAACSPS